MSTPKTDKSLDECHQITRRLIFSDSKTQVIEVIPDSAITTLPVSLVVILGDPGLGKTTLAKELGKDAGNQYVRAGTFARSLTPHDFLPAPEGRLIIDGLDEIASLNGGDGLDAILVQLSALGLPRAVVTSREADWRGASARAKLEDDYGEKPEVLHLQPFDRYDAFDFLKARFPELDAGRLLDHFSARGLDDIGRNPLTLGMMGDIARADGDLPGTRAELLERACATMLREENPRHLDSSHASRAENQMLLAAGAVFAGLLLCGRLGVYDGPARAVPDGYAGLVSLAALPGGEAATDVLKTRLFQADGPSRFVPCHRVVAEYLGARWLADRFEAGVSSCRILALLARPDGVPTSLRGLNAWLAHFSGRLAPACISADPYAVLRYGNAETLPLDQARHLLRELAKLAEEDPWFRSEDWARHPATGLARAELKAELLECLSDEKAPLHLVLLVLEAVAGSPAAVSAMKDDLEALLFDPRRSFAPRSRAADALFPKGETEALEPAVERLLAAGDSDSHRIAYEALCRTGFVGRPARLLAEAILAHAGLTVSQVDRSGREQSIYLPDEALDAMGSDALLRFLDLFCDYAAPFMRGGGFRAEEVVADLVRQAVAAALRSPGSIEPERLWNWLRSLRHRSGYETSAKSAIRERLAADDALRQGVQAAALLGAPADEIRFEAYGLRDFGAHLQGAADALALLDALADRDGDPPDPVRMKELLLLAKEREGLPPEVRERASALARRDPAFERELDELSRPFVDTHDRERRRRESRERARRKKVYAGIRAQHETVVAEVLAGDFRWLKQPATAYLGRFRELEAGERPTERLEMLLGRALAADALEGFMASLWRSDLPSAGEIARSHASNQAWNVEAVLVCGVAELVRRGLDTGSVPRPALESACMAWRRQGEAHGKDELGIGAALEPLVFADDASAEVFFRTSVEPQLEAGTSYPCDLNLLLRDGRWAALAGKLAVEWLDRFPALPEAVLVDLLDTGVRRGGGEGHDKITSIGHERVHQSLDILMEWLATDFVLDFEDARACLAEAAKEDPGFIWRVRGRSLGERSGGPVPLSIPQREFVVRTFSAAWPLVPHPTTSSGDTNPWDASEFIQRMASSIGADPSADATDALERLLSAADPSYNDSLRHGLAQQRKLRRDSEFSPASVELLLAVATGALPRTVDDMRAYFGDRLSVVQARMHATNTDMWEAYWDGNAPRGENFCRNRLVEHISAQLPEAVRFEPEALMPGQKRADIAAIHGGIGLPVEIKGQWHPQVWDAATEQLEALYARDWHAEGRGAYIVVWFGNVPGKQLPPHPEGLPAPESPGELLGMLVDRLPPASRGLIDVYVIDVSRMG